MSRPAAASSSHQRRDEDFMASPGHEIAHHFAIVLTLASPDISDMKRWTGLAPRRWSRWSPIETKNVKFKESIFNKERDRLIWR